MGIPYADHIMNAVVLTAVLSCLNSGLYTASRMLFVLAGAAGGAGRADHGQPPRRAGLGASCPRRSSGSSASSRRPSRPDTVFLFLLNSSGAIILFVYLLIAISQLVLRRRTPPERLRVRMWLFPCLTIATIAGDRRRPGADVRRRRHPVPAPAEPARRGPWCSCSTWSPGGGAARWTSPRRRRRQQPADAGARPGERDRRRAASCSTSCGRIDARGQGRSTSSACRPIPVDTGQAEVKGAVWVWQATVEAARRPAGLDAGDPPLATGWTRAASSATTGRCTRCGDAVAAFRPDRIVIATHPEGRSTWLRHGSSTRPGSCTTFPVLHIVATAPAAIQA